MYGIADAGSGPLVDGWLHWRGPYQNGTSSDTNLPSRIEIGGTNHLWTFDLSGRGTAVIATDQPGFSAARGGEELAGVDRVYVWGYRGERSDLVEVLACLDADSGEVIWEHEFSDFISDIIYNRYSIGSPTVDPQTGNIYLMTTPGLLLGFDHDGKLLWQRSMMEEFGRLTFPNGRTGAPSLAGNLVIVNTISTNWGREGPGRNRFYAFDKINGELVWSSTPGVGPPFLKDSSFSSPRFDWHDGQPVFYVGTGCGNIVCVNVQTGHPVWRFQFAAGGVNSSVVLHEDAVIAIHGKENIDDTGRGRMVAIRYNGSTEPGLKGPTVLNSSAELWRNDDLSMFTSSPVIVGDDVYQVTVKGDLVCVDARTGQTRWHKKLGADQLHASPVHADGKLYIPMWHDGLFIIRPTNDGAEILDQVQLDGRCLGSPSVWNGRVYVHTTKKLYCFGGERIGANQPAMPINKAASTPQSGKLMPVPAEFLIRPGESQAFDVRNTEGDSLSVSERMLAWSKFIPDSGKVKSEIDGHFNDDGVLVATPGGNRSAGAFRLVKQSEGQSDSEGVGYIRGRVLPSPPYSEDFQGFQLKHKRKDGRSFAYPPLPWIGARLKWQIHDFSGNQVLAKTLDRWLFQRSIVFMGHADDRNYSITADVMSDGNRRQMSDVGLINQRYIVTLRGNPQQLEVNSNIERLSAKVPFLWKPGIWYRLATRVDVNQDGSGTVMGKVWPRDGVQPSRWNIEVPVNRVHTNGSPGLFGFTPNIKFGVYIDNIRVEPNE